MKRYIVASLVCSLLASQVFAIGRRKASYVGGTIASLNQNKRASEGELVLSDEKVFLLRVKDTSIEVPYDRISAIEYQKSSHLRTGAMTGTLGVGYLSLALATSVAAFAIFPVTLMAIPFVKKKKKRHFLTVAYKDADDKPQALVLELGKDIEKEARAAISVRSGVEVKVIVEDK